MQIIVRKMNHKEYQGDWHDKPLAWEVIGPSGERQIFSTRDNARHYARCRRAAVSQSDAIKNYI